MTIRAEQALGALLTRLDQIGELSADGLVEQWHTLAPLRDAGRVALQPVLSACPSCDKRCACWDADERCCTCAHGTVGCDGSPTPRAGDAREEEQ